MQCIKSRVEIVYFYEMKLFDVEQKNGFLRLH